MRLKELRGGIGARALSEGKYPPRTHPPDLRENGFAVSEQPLEGGPARAAASSRVVEGRDPKARERKMRDLRKMKAEAAPGVGKMDPLPADVAVAGAASSCPASKAESMSGFLQLLHRFNKTESEKTHSQRLSPVPSAS